MSTIIQNFYKAIITRNWTATTGDFNVSVKPTSSSGWLVISPNNSTLREIIKYTATGTNAYGDYVTISNVSDRGIGGTTAQTHTIGESIRMNITAEHWKELNDTIDGIVAAGAPDADTTTKGLVEEATQTELIAGTAVGNTGAKLFVPVNMFPTIETSSGTTHSLTTLAGQKVIVWVKGYHLGNGNGSASVYLKYNSTTKDTVDFGNYNTNSFPFSLMYTETPGAGTQNITVESTAGLSSVVIVVMKFY